jgi:hypothetical protein
VVVGGEHGPTPTTELYDPSNATWSLSGNMIVPRSAHRTVLLPSGNILVVAGFNGAPPSLEPLSPDFDHHSLTEAGNRHSAGRSDTYADADCNADAN